VVYCAANPATALLEVLVHAEIEVGDLPLSYRFLEIEVPDGVPRETVEIQRLPIDWVSKLQETRRVGDEWIVSIRTAILFVPCAIVPGTLNMLVNPLHPDSASIIVTRVHRHLLDSRLFRA